MIEVSDGYARNYMLPRKLAVEATADNVNTMRMNDKAMQEQAPARARGGQRHRRQAHARPDRDRLCQGRRRRTSVRLRHRRRRSPTRCKQQAAAFSSTSRKIVLDEPIKTAGIIPSSCKLGYEITADLKVSVEIKAAGNTQQEEATMPMDETC